MIEKPHEAGHTVVWVVGHLTRLRAIATVRPGLLIAHQYHCRPSGIAPAHLYCATHPPACMLTVTHSYRNAGVGHRSSPVSPVIGWLPVQFLDSWIVTVILLPP